MLPSLPLLACSDPKLPFVSVTLQIYWTAASAVSAPPLTPQAKWRECRLLHPATRLSHPSKICPQNEYGVARDSKMDLGEKAPLSK